MRELFFKGASKCLTKSAIAMVSLRGLGLGEVVKSVKKSEIEVDGA